MSEQKYYVKLKPSISVIVEHDDQDNEIEFGYGYLNGLHEFSPWTPGNKFTKSELASIEDGAFYRMGKHYCKNKGHGLCCKPSGCREEWVNPLVKLIPVEEIENV